MAEKKITQAGLFALLERQQRRCALTGRKLEPTDAALDHSIPLGRGGANDLDNVQIVHRDINNAKGSMTTAEFIEMCKEVVRYV